MDKARGGSKSEVVKLGVNNLSSLVAVDRKAANGGRGGGGSACRDADCSHICLAAPHWSGPIRGQYSGHVTSLDQSEASIQVT